MPVAENDIRIIIRQEIYDLNQSRLMELSERAEAKEKQSEGKFIVVCFDADDPEWTVALNLLMPDHDWQQYRDRGERPFGRGVIPREVAERLVAMCPTAGKLPDGIHILVFGGGGLSIYARA